MSCGEKRRGEKCLVGRNVIWGEMSWGEMSWVEMLRGELSFGVKCYRALGVSSLLDLGERIANCKSGS